MLCGIITEFILLFIFVTYCNQRLLNIHNCFQREKESLENSEHCQKSVRQTLLFVFVTVFTGRWLMSFWTGSAKIHELYTAACGLYVCWLSIRAITVLLAWMPQGRRVILLKVQEWTLMVLNAVVSLYLKYFLQNERNRKRGIDKVGSK